MSNITNGTSRQPVEASDKIIPLGMFDSAVLKRLTLIYTTFLFPDVLDTAKLRHGLELLTINDGWNKLGARLKRNEKTGGLEHHIPTRFTKDRSAFRYYHAQHDMAIADHAVASKFPTITSEPAVMADPNDFQSLWLHSGTPTSFGQYLKLDEPQLGVFFASFNDATVMTLSWPHSLFDTMGLGEFLHAWSLIVQEPSSEIPRPITATEDSLAELGRSPAEPYTLAKSQLSWFGLLIFFCRTLFEIMFSKQQSRMIYVPALVIQSLRENALHELRNTVPGIDDPFISEGDVLSAWWAKMNISHYPTGSKKLVHLANAVGWRPTLAGNLLPSGRPYLSNAVGLASTLIPAKDLLSKPLSHIARQVRQCIVESRRREQVEAYASLWRNSPGKLPPLFGNPTMRMVTCSNWSKANLFHLDFSAACVKRSAAVLSTELGRPSYVQSCFRGVYLSNIMVIVGKDTHGGYWLTAFTGTKHWKRIKDAIAKIECVPHNR